MGNSEVVDALTREMSSNIHRINITNFGEIKIHIEERVRKYISFLKTTVKKQKTIQHLNIMYHALKLLKRSIDDKNFDIHRFLKKKRYELILQDDSFKTIVNGGCMLIDFLHGKESYIGYRADPGVPVKTVFAIQTDWMSALKMQKKNLDIEIKKYLTEIKKYFKDDKQRLMSLHKINDVNVVVDFYRNNPAVFVTGLVSLLFSLMFLYYTLVEGGSEKLIKNDFPEFILDGDAGLDGGGNLLGEGEWKDYTYKENDYWWMESNNIRLVKYKKVTLRKDMTIEEVLRLFGGFEERPSVTLDLNVLKKLNPELKGKLRKNALGKDFISKGTEVMVFKLEQPKEGA